MQILLDRRKTFTAGTLAAGETTWTLPYSCAVDASEGTVQVVTADGTVLTSTRPSATTVKVVGDYSATTVYIGLQYEFRGTLSTIYLRNADSTGIIRADSRKRLQVQRVRFQHEDTYKYDVTVQGLERSLVTYPFSSAAADSDDLIVPVLSNNEQVTVIITSPYPVPVWISSMEWEGFFKARSSLR